MMKTLSITLFFMLQFLTLSLFANPASQIVERLMPSQGKNFEFNIDKTLKAHTFKIESKNKKIAISGSDQSAVNAGLGHYFRHVANLLLSDCGDNITPPAKWPEVKETIEKTTPSKYRSAYNYCTFSYTFTNFGWDEWQRELDRIALNGTNLALVLPGHQRVWQRTLHRLGVSNEDIMKFIPSPAFSAWWLMANLEGEGGPITQEVIDSEAKIGRQICDRMRELGIEPIVNGFIGAVPTFLPKYVKGNYISQGNWCDLRRPIVLSPLDPSFVKIADIWYDELHSQFGAVNYYGGDLFHEGGNTGGVDLPKCGKIIETEMRNANPKAVYVMQAWSGTPKEEMVRVIDNDHILIQQLTLDISTLQYGHYRTFSGRPWILTEIGNFGGNSGMYGNLKTQAAIPGKLFEKRNGNVIGMGLTAEGFRYNPVVYDLWTDVMWTDTAIDLNSWLKGFIVRRYGSLNPKALEAWQLLEKSVYSAPKAQEAVTDFVMGAIPHPDCPRARFWCRNDFYWELQPVVEAAQALIQAEANTEGWRYDMVDVIRQMFNGYTSMLRDDIMTAYHDKDKVTMEKKMAEFLEVFDDLDKLLATDKYHLLGRELERAKTRSNDPATAQALATMHLRLYTTWVSNPRSPLNDYASRSLSGLVKDYYKARWALWFKDLKKSYDEGKAPANYNRDIIDREWYKSPKKYPTTTTGNTTKVAKKIIDKYATKIIARAKLEKGKIGYPCRLSGSKNQPITVDVTNEITSKGKFKATVLWEDGTHGLKISKIELYSGTKKVAEDVHAGYAGIRKENNSYTLNLPKYREALENYTLRIHGEGDGGNDWRGKIIFQRVK